MSAHGSPDNTDRGACFEFRCPGYVRNGTHEFFNLATAIEAHITTSDTSKTCKLRYGKKFYNTLSLYRFHQTINKHFIIETSIQI